MRMKRSVFLVEDGVIKYFALDEDDLINTSAEAVFKAIWFLFISILCEVKYILMINFNLI